MQIFNKQCAELIMQIAIISEAPAHVCNMGNGLFNVSVRPDCPAALIVGEIVSALNGGHYGVAGGASNEAALVG